MVFHDSIGAVPPPPLALYDDTLKEALLSNETSSSTSTNHTGWSTDNTNANNNTNQFTTYLFFIFAGIGLIVIVFGFYCLHRRQVRQDAEAIRQHRERTRQANREQMLERRLKEERRTRLVETALITTKVTFFPKRKSSPRGRSATMETMESGEMTDDLDSTMSSSCNELRDVMIRRVSEVSTSEVSSTENSQCDDENESESGKDELNVKDELSNAGHGQSCHENSNSPNEMRSSNISTINESETNTTSELESTALQNQVSNNDTRKTSLDWQTELCAICLEPYKENDDVSYSKHQNCAHAFHTSCIKSWLNDQYRNDCPCCRGPYLHLCVVEEDGDYLGGGGGGGNNHNSNGMDNLNAIVDVREVMDPTSFENANATAETAPPTQATTTPEITTTTTNNFNNMEREADANV